MTDPAETRRKLERLMKRVTLRDDYSRLLHNGVVEAKASEIDDPEEWRAAIKRQSDEDRITVQTGLNGGVLWAEVQGSGQAPQDDMLLMNRVLQSVLPRAVGHRHEPASLLRDQGEFGLACERCSAIGYVDGTVEPPLSEGDLFEEDCPNEDPPKATRLTEVWGGHEALKRLWEQEGGPSNP